MLGLLLAGWMLAPLSTAAGQRYDGPVIDTHQHADSELRGSHRICLPRPCDAPATEAKTAAELKPMTLAAMRRNNIVLAVVMDNPVDVQAWTDSEGDRMLTGLSVGDPKDRPLQTLRPLFASGRAQVLGEISSQYEGITLDDPRLDPYFAMAAEFDVPVHAHLMGAGGRPGFPSHLGNPLQIVPLLQKYPNLRVYLENAAWPFLEEITALMYQYENVYVEISTITHVIPRPVTHRYLKALIDSGLGKRIMFGSDQMSWPEVIDIAVDTIQAADFLTPEQKADIFYNNAARFFRLTPAQIQAHHRAVDAARE